MTLIQRFLLACACISSFFSSYSQDIKPFVLGEIREIQSEILGEKRILNIYLPEGFTKNDTIKYPVVYLLDGSADEDFIHIAGLVQFFNFPWINAMPKSIVVGIANTDRRRDFTFPTTIAKDKTDFPTTGGSAKFIDFLEKELQPYIARTYPVNESRTIVGQSLGGLLATEILFTKPHLFTKYLIVSPSLWWDNEVLLIDTFINKLNVTNVNAIYIAVGSEGKIMVNDANKLAEILKKKGAKVLFEFFDKEDHSNILHKAAYSGFEKLNRNKKAQPK